MQAACVRRTIDLDKELACELDRVASLTKEKPAVIIRHALRAGLPVVANRFQAPRPDGYFADSYPRPEDQQALQAAMLKVPQRRKR